MATIINNPGGGESANANGGGSGLIVGIVIAIVVLAIVFLFVLPNMRGGNATPAPAAAPEAMEPTANDGGDTMNIEVPDEIDVNIKR